jgi:hypothetical protein
MYVHLPVCVCVCVCVCARAQARGRNTKYLIFYAFFLNLCTFPPKLLSFLFYISTLHTLLYSIRGASINHHPILGSDNGDNTSCQRCSC